MRISFGSATHAGKIRDENQDKLAWDVDYQEPAGLFIVADGMGGHRGGAVASSVAVKEALRSFREAQDVDITARMRHAVMAANKVVITASSENPMLSGMGTTMSAIYVNPIAITIAHVGDSRVYRVLGADVHQMTVDHLRSVELAKALNISIEEAWKYSPKNALSRAVGIHSDLKVDIMVHNAIPGEYWVICSDGMLSVPPEMICSALKSDTLDQAAQQLVHAALDLDGSDNISVLIVALNPASTIS